MVSAEHEVAVSQTATVLRSESVQSLAVDQALEKIGDVFSPKHSRNNVYAMVVYGKNQQPTSNPLKAVGIFLEAYWQGWRTFSRCQASAPSAPTKNFLDVHQRASGDICIYREENFEEMKQTMPASPGVYVFISQLDSSLLNQMQIPLFPKEFRESRIVLQVKMDALCEQNNPSKWSAWKTLESSINSETETREQIERDTLAWRQKFVEDYKCLTSAQVAEESGSKADNRYELASRWSREEKIFAIKYEGKLLYPHFQFRDGNPIPVVSSVIKLFPKYATGWDLAFFFTSPNSYIGGRKPLELLKGDTEKLVSLARTFANPADAF